MTVESVEVLGDAAMAQVLVTQKQAGNVRQFLKLQFYTHTATGWQRTRPVASFWGPTSTLDTDRLHSVFQARDRALVDQISPTAEALYTGLIQAFDQQLARSGPLTIEIVPGPVASGARYAGGQIKITSLELFYPAFGLASADTLMQSLRTVMCEPMRAAALHQHAFKSQWQPLVNSLTCQLITDAIITHAKSAGVVQRDPSREQPPVSFALKDLLATRSQPSSVPQPAYRSTCRAAPPGPTYSD